MATGVTNARPLVEAFQRVVARDAAAPLIVSPSRSFSAGEISDLATGNNDRYMELYAKLAKWESTLPTVPLWGSSPRWISESAKHYDGWAPRDEPE